MSKRDASDYITKDGIGSMSAPPERVPRAATAAQMAARKLKAPRGRLHGGISSTGSPAFTPTPNLFGQIGAGSIQFSTPFGNNIPSGGSHFNTSASFPPSKASSINFTPAPPSGSFTFGASTPANPFSNIGANTANNDGNTVNFGGFGAQTNGPTNSQDGDTMMESPQKKPPAFGTSFGTGSSSARPAATFLFGQTSQSAAPSGFGSSATTQAPNNTFQFSQSQPAAQPGSLFGFSAQQPEEPKSQTPLFGQPMNTSQPAMNLFNQPASGPPSSSSLFSKPTSAFNPSSKSFGQTPATSTTPGNIFGTSAPATQPSNGGTFSTLFGQTPVPVKPVTDSHTSSELPKPSFNFAPSTSQPSFSFSAAPASTANPSVSNSSPQAPDLTPMFSAPDSVGPVFSGGLVSGSLGDIFKPNANARLASPETSAVSSETPSAKSNPFAFKPTTSSTQQGFSSTTGQFGTKLGENTIHGGLFERVARPAEPAATTAATTTSQNPIENVQESSTKQDTTSNALNLFGKGPEAEPTSRPRIEPTKSQENPNQSFKGFQPRSSTQQPLPSSTSSFSSVFGALANTTSSVAQQSKQPSDGSSKSSPLMKSLASGSRDASFTPADSQAKEPSWHAPKVTSSPANVSLSTTLTPSTYFKAAATPQSTTAKSKQSTSTSSESDVRLRSYGSSAIPSYLNSEESVEHDSLSRLRNLNFSFQKKIAKLDPAADDFEETVRHYVAQRTHIGHALNLKERNRAGMKRKIDSSEANEESLNGSKKARTEGFSSESTKCGMPPTATDDSSTSANIQPPKTFGTQSASQQIGLGNNIDSSSAASGMFKNMTPSPKPASAAFPSVSAASNPHANPFATLKGSAPSSGLGNSNAEPAALAPGAGKETEQHPNPFASLSTNPSTSSGSVLSSSSTTLFRPLPPSTTPTRSPPKKPAFEVPQFGANSGASFMDAFAKQSAQSTADLEAEAKRKRKAEDFDSDEDDEAEWERKYEEEQRAKRNKLESLSKSGTTGFQPLLGNKETSATAKKFLSLANDKAPRSRPAPEKSSFSAGSAGFDRIGTADTPVEKPLTVSDEESNDSRGSEEREESVSQAEDSDQGDEEDSGRDEEDISEGDQDQDANYEEGEEQASEEESEDEDIQAAMARSKSKGSLFDRIEPNPNLKPKEFSRNGASNAQKEPNGIPLNSSEAKATPNVPKASQATVNSSFKPFGANGVLNSGTFRSTPDAPTMSPFTPINGSGSDTKDPFAPAGSVFAASKKQDTGGSSSSKANGETFSFGSNTSESAPTAARSILLGANATVGSSTIPGEGLFGSRPSTPSNDEPLRGSVFGNLGSGSTFLNSKGDYTFKPGTQVKFGTPNKDGPTVNITAATPPAKDDASAASKSFPNLFGPKPSKPGAEGFANVGFNFGGPTHLTASPLLGASAFSSAVSSRATSPGATDTESVNTDTAEDQTNEPQTSLMSSRPGEENEEVLFEARSKALKFIPEAVAKEKKLEPGFNTQGVGQLRVLKHKTTGKTRLLLRAEPGSNIVINTALTPSMIYKATEGKGSGAVKFGIPTAIGIDQWVAKVKTPAMAEELAGILEANKDEGVER